MSTSRLHFLGETRKRGLERQGTAQDEVWIPHILMCTCRCILQSAIDTFTYTYTYPSAMHTSYSNIPKRKQPP